MQAKGYPDISSRAFVHRLTTQSPGRSVSTPQVFGLVDFDPDGINILSTYKHGSAAFAHENGRLNAPGLLWIGAHSSDVLSIEAAGDRRSVQPLTTRDRRKARIMLEKPIFAEGGAEPHWRAELQIMLMLNVKAEMQVLSDIDGGIEGWLDKKITAELASASV